jgi:hypothetical protein
MVGKKRWPRKACFVEVKSVNDVARLACALERTPLPTFGIDYHNSNLIAVQGDFFRGIAVIYFAKAAKVNHFLAYRNLAGNEEVKFVDSAAIPGYSYSPVIMIKGLPKEYEDELEACIKGVEQIKEKYLAIKLKDLISLGKVSSYKILYEEPPLPIYLMPYKGSYIAGSFTRTDESENSALFFCTSLKNEPDGNFLSLSTTNVSDVKFTNNLEQYGRIYVKIIRLRNLHPLIKVDDL